MLSMGSDGGLGRVGSMSLSIRNTNTRDDSIRDTYNLFN